MKPFSLFRRQLNHSRTTPVGHAFRYKVFLVWVHLNRLEELNSLSRWWSTTKFNLVRFDRRHYLLSDQPLLNEVYSVIKQQTGKEFSDGVFLLGNLNYWGYCYNPATLLRLLYAKQMTFFHVSQTGHLNHSIDY